MVLKDFGAKDFFERQRLFQLNFSPTEEIAAMFLLPRLFFLRISSVLNTAYSTSSHVGALGEVKSRTPSPYILPQFSKNSAFPFCAAFAGSSGHHCPSHTEKEKKVSENTSMAALYLGSLTPLQPFKVDEGVSLTGQPAKSSQTRHRNPNRSGRSACGRAMASLAACPASHGCSKKPTQPLLLPKRNKIKVLFNKTGSPKQSQRGAAHGHEQAPPRALLGPSSLGASRQGRGPGQRCCMALRPPAAGTQMAGDSRRRGQQESSGAARHRLGRQRATRTDKAAGAMRRCGRARPFTGSSWLQACSLPVP